VIQVAEVAALQRACIERHEMERQGVG
jgi:hypothetical protein